MEDTTIVYFPRFSPKKPIYINRILFDAGVG